MTAKEMFELAKAGYKPSEIAEMHKLMKDADVEPIPESEPQPEPQPIPEPEPQPTPEPEPQPTPEPEIDYKKLYEESQEKLAAAQQENIRKDIAGAREDDNDILAKAIKGFM